MRQNSRGVCIVNEVKDTILLAVVRDILKRRNGTALGDNLVKIIKGEVNDVDNCDQSLSLARRKLSAGRDITRRD